MIDYQTALIEKLAANRVAIQAVFDGPFLNCKVAVTSNKKIKWQKFSFQFDTADDCQGWALVAGSQKGAYSDAFAEQAAAIIQKHADEIAVAPYEV